MTTNDGERRNLVGGFLKGLTVIEAFDGDRPRQSISDIAKSTGFDRATCRRLLLTMVHAGFAEHDGKQFWLSPRIVRLGAGYLRNATLPNLIQPFLERLSGRIAESCSASIQDDLHVIYIARASSRRVMSINLMAGSRLPLYCSSMGRVLLASHPDDEVVALLERSELLAHTPNTITSIPELVDEVRKVRESGFAIVDQELELGLRSVAVAIHDSRGKALAAVNIGTHASAVPEAVIKTRYLEELMSTKRDIEKSLTSIIG